MFYGPANTVNVISSWSVKDTVWFENIIFKLFYISIDTCYSLECEIHTKITFFLSLIIKLLFEEKFFFTVVANFVFLANTAINPCPAESGYTLSLQTVRFRSVGFS